MYRVVWIEKTGQQFHSEVFENINDAWDYLHFFFHPENITIAWVEEAEWVRVEE